MVFAKNKQPKERGGEHIVPDSSSNCDNLARAYPRIKGRKAWQTSQKMAR
jgi:hypothetical protein